MRCLCGLLVLVFALCSHAETPASLREFQPDSSPAKIGVRLAENWAARSFEWQTSKRPHVIYPEVIAWYGSLRVAALTGDTKLRDRLVEKYGIYFTGDGLTHISPRPHVDYRVFGMVPLELYLQTKQARYREAGRSFADKQWEHPTADGLTREARYWVDDMYMIPALQVQAFRATREAKYLDRAAMTVVAYLDKLQQSNGLFLHAPDSPFYWGRGNGWFAAGMAELLRDLPTEHPQRERILAGYRKMMAALLATQAESGLWRQLIDVPESWEETSGSAMFAFAFVSGVKRGWLDEKTYAPAARKAWLALVAQLDPQANVREVCAGTNKGAREVGPDLGKQKAFYLARPRNIGDLHGQGAMLWTAFALLE